MKRITFSMLVYLISIVSVFAQNAADILNKAYENFKVDYKLGVKESIFTKEIDNISTIVSIGKYKHPLGFAQIEVHQTSPIKVLICVPESVSTSSSKIAYKWYDFEFDGTNFKQSNNPVLYGVEKKTDYLPKDFLYKNFAFEDVYEVEITNPLECSTPPHWMPILLNGNSFETIHKKMNSTNRQEREDGFQLIKNAKPSKKDEITNRAEKKWQSVTLRGFIEDSHFPIEDGDASMDHYAGFREHDGDCTTCQEYQIFEQPEDRLDDFLDLDIVDAIKPDFEVKTATPSECPGMDWNMHILPDNAYKYLVSQAHNSEISNGKKTIEVEISHFAIPYAYNLTDITYTNGLPVINDIDKLYPKKGEWLQAIGRWTVDCGHYEDNRDLPAEIHPPELLVSQYFKKAENKTLAKVVLTGAAKPTNKLKFVIFPPPRQSPTSVLKYEVKIYDSYKNFSTATFKPSGSAKANSNYYLEGEVSATGDQGNDDIELNCRGLVAMSSKRQYAAEVYCWWEDAPMATVNYTLKTRESNPIKSSVFYKNSMELATDELNVKYIKKSNGQQTVPLSSAPNFIDWLKIRPAGSGWDFLGQNAPKLINDLQNKEIRNIEIIGVERNYGVAALNQNSPLIKAIDTPLLSLNGIGLPNTTSKYNQNNSVCKVLETEGFKAGFFDSENEFHFGVKNNGMGLKEEIVAFCQLSRIDIENFKEHMTSCPTQNPLLSPNPFKEETKAITNEIMKEELINGAGEFDISRSKNGDLINRTDNFNRNAIDRTLGEFGKGNTDEILKYKRAKHEIGLINKIGKAGSRANDAGNIREFRQTVYNKIGEGVQGAKIKVSLLAGNKEIGFYPIDNGIETTTDEFGMVSIKISAGSVSEDIYLGFEVLENGKNKEYKPTRIIGPVLFYPSISRDDQNKTPNYSISIAPNPDKARKIIEKSQKKKYNDAIYAILKQAKGKTYTQTKNIFKANNKKK
jgi:hypothetical protein